jgi:hypothetical protein
MIAVIECYIIIYVLLCVKLHFLLLNAHHVRLPSYSERFGPKFAVVCTYVE